MPIDSWFSEFKKSTAYQSFVKAPVAYFCAEYALDGTLPTYAGGLGVLSGDYVREVASQDFPLVAVGLLYKKAQNSLSLDQHEEKQKLKNVIGKDGKEIVVSVPIEGRIVKAKAYHWQEGKVNVYLLDTDITENDTKDRLITTHLYDEDRAIRLKQEIILGIGGFRLLAKLGYHASVYHLNEGHSAFLALELVRHEMEHQKANFKDACEYAQKHILFTNHTLVLAGQEQFNIHNVNLFLADYAKEIGVETKDITALGVSEDNPNSFSMTTFSFRLSSKCNGVSLIHSKEAKKVWPKELMDSVTNGVFVGRWDKMENVPTSGIWEKHLENKRKLLALVKDVAGEVWNENDLIFVWARRLVEYKQPLLFLDNLEKLLEISKNSSIPIRLIFSGPTGEIENPFVAKIKNIIEAKLAGTAAFVPNYSTDFAEILTAGADVWLNTPKVGFEACGTSGMKAGLNGVLSLSTADGWVYEVKPEDIGWVIDDKTAEGGIFSIVEKYIVPEYANHLKNTTDSLWTKKMEKVRNLILNDFSTSRMLKEYIEKLYIPVLLQKHTHKID